MTPIIMPQIGQDLKTGVIIEWVKNVNDPVKKGDIVLVVESEKASFEVESDTDGVLLKQLYREGEEAEVLSPVGYIGDPGEQIDTGPAPGSAAAPAVPAVGKDSAAAAEGPAAGVSGKSAVYAPGPETAKIKISPIAKRIAKERGIDYTAVRGTGPGGRIIKENILEAGQGMVPYSRMRRVIADRLTLSKQSIPHFYLFMDINMEKSARWREKTNEAFGKKITYTDIFLYAAAKALQVFPKMNASADKDGIVLKNTIDIGVAVSVEDGLLVPLVKKADTKTIFEISEEVKTLAEKARQGKTDSGPARQPEGQSGGFTFTALGMYGISAFLPIINPPQCAILAAGAVEERVVPENGLIGIRRMATLSLSADHRAIDGTYAAGFLQSVKTFLEDWEV